MVAWASDNRRGTTSAALPTSPTDSGRRDATASLPAAGTAAAVSLLRRKVPGPGPDHWLSPELAAADRMPADEALVAAAAEATGPLV